MKKVIILIASGLLVVILSMIMWYFLSLGAVSKNSEEITFTIERGSSSKEVISNLYSAGLIKSRVASYIYAKLNKIVIQAGSYTLNKNMPTAEIMGYLKKGGTNNDTIRITFIEGLRLEEYLDLIAQNFNWSKDDLVNKINDPEFLQKMIAKYDFLTDEILNKDLYYGLEGYLYPDTYEFYKNATFEEIITKMLDQMAIKISELELPQDYSFHEILTMASIIEKESPQDSEKNANTREKIAQVIYKRLALKMNLGMDVTTYYGVKKSMKENLTKADLNDNNPYNTRNPKLIGLPVGPICSPSLKSLKAALNPADTNYVYFFADIKTGDVYFTDNYNEFLVFKEKYS